MTALILMRSWLSYLREQRAKIHALPGLQWIFPESYCNSGVIPLKYAYLPFPSILGILIVRSFPAAVISSKSNVTIQYLHSYVQKSIPDQLR